MKEKIKQILNSIGEGIIELFFFHYIIEDQKKTIKDNERTVKYLQCIISCQNEVIDALQKVKK
jgi:hypothetical protein